MPTPHVPVPHHEYSFSLAICQCEPKWLQNRNLGNCNVIRSQLRVADVPPLSTTTHFTGVAIWTALASLMEGGRSFNSGLLYVFLCTDKYSDFVGIRHAVLWLFMDQEGQNLRFRLIFNIETPCSTAALMLRVLYSNPVSTPFCCYTRTRLIQLTRVPEVCRLEPHQHL